MLPVEMHGVLGVQALADWRAFLEVIELIRSVMILSEPVVMRELTAPPPVRSEKHLGRSKWECGCRHRSSVGVEYSELSRMRD